jgi:phosphoribosylglycinamide formyltransferase 1
MRKLRVGVLISGRGSNMRALVEAGRDPDCPAEVVLVASNVAEAGGIVWAKEQGIATAVVNHKNYASREAFDTAMNAELQKHNLDLICCAGFMRIMTSVLIAPWSGRMLNIHPSLLPDYKGLHTHARAIADGRSEAGCTVHFVTEELDGGPIVAQARVPILIGDTEDALSARVLAEEHPLYVKALAQVATSLAARLQVIQRRAD